LLLYASFSELVWQDFISLEHHNFSSLFIGLVNYLFVNVFIYCLFNKNVNGPPNVQFVFANTCSGGLPHSYP
jgi:hypothetical protein